jgi:hypothetical protein
LQRWHLHSSRLHRSWRVHWPFLLKHWPHPCVHSYIFVSPGASAIYRTRRRDLRHIGRYRGAYIRRGVSSLPPSVGSAIGFNRVETCWLSHAMISGSEREESVLRLSNSLLSGSLSGFVATQVRSHIRTPRLGLGIMTCISPKAISKSFMIWWRASRGAGFGGLLQRLRADLSPQETCFMPALLPFLSAL